MSEPAVSSGLFDLLVVGTVLGISVLTVVVLVAEALVVNFRQTKEPPNEE